LAYPPSLFTTEPEIDNPIKAWLQLKSRGMKAGEMSNKEARRLANQVPQLSKALRTDQYLQVASSANTFQKEAKLPVRK
jgi:hypothetical protein